MEPMKTVIIPRISQAYWTQVPRRRSGPTAQKIIRITAITPALVIRPESRALAGAGATGCAVGSQLCMGKRPALVPKPITAKKTIQRKTSFPLPSAAASTVPPHRKARSGE